MKVLITGGNGFIGQRITRILLAKGVAVRWASRSRPNRLPANVEHMTLDMAAPEGLAQVLEGCTHVIHLAAREDMPVLPRGDPDGELMFQTNVRGTDRLLKACREAALDKIVVVTSVFTFGWKRTPGPDDGSCPHNLSAMRSVYVESRYQQEFVCLEHAAAGLPVVICAPSIVVGAGDTKLAGPAVRAVQKGLIKAVPAGGVNCIDVEDVAQGLVSALTQGVPGTRYPLVGHNVRWHTFFSLIAEAVGCPPPVLLPEWVIRLGLFVVRGFDRFVRGRHSAFLIGPELLSGDFYFSRERAARELQLPCTPMKRSIEQTVVWVKTGQLPELPAVTEELSAASA